MFLGGSWGFVRSLVVGEILDDGVILRIGLLLVRGLWVGWVGM